MVESQRQYCSSAPIFKNLFMIYAYEKVCRLGAESLISSTLGDSKYEYHEVSVLSVE
jgi:hypothetical protein